MDLKRYAYKQKDMPFLNSDAKKRLTFFVLFLAVFVWQVVAFFLRKRNDAISTLELIISICVMVVSLLFLMVSFLCYYKTKKDIHKVKNKKPAFATITFKFKTNRDGFIHLYLTISKIIAVLSAILLVVALTYSVLTYVYYNTISYYLPLLALCVVCGFNGAYHMEAQIYAMESLQNQNRII